MQTPLYPEPYFITPHAVRRFQERVNRRMRYHEVVVWVQNCLQDAAPYPPDRTIAIGNKGGGSFVAIVEPPTETQPWPQVVTIWAWNICPILLKRKGRNGSRRYRWLNNPYPGASAQPVPHGRIMLL